MLVMQRRIATWGSVWRRGWAACLKGGGLYIVVLCSASDIELDPRDEFPMFYDSDCFVFYIYVRAIDLF